MVFLKSRFKKLWYKHVIQTLKQTRPDEAIKISEKRALQVFKRASRLLPFYQECLKQIGFTGQSIQDIDAFRQHVPIVDKETIFHRDPAQSFFSETDIDRIQSILLSSGSSGNFSFGVNTEREIKANTRFLGVLLHYYFNILEEKTLIINCLVQAVKLPSVNAVAVEVGPRADSLIYLLKKLSPAFSQTIIIGDNYFLKNALEEGKSEGLDYRHLKIHLILGGVYLTENLRVHLGRILGLDSQKISSGTILSSMGISEFGLNLFFESRETILLRRLIKENSELRSKLLKADDPPFIPMVFSYFPQAFYIEEHNQQIVITNLNPEAQLPLIRYNTHDRGRLIPYYEAQGMLKPYGDNRILTPFKSSLVLLYGKDEALEIKQTKIYPQQIQRGLYGDPEIASLITGYFRLRKENNQACLEIQIKKGIELDERTKKKLTDAALLFALVDIPVKIYPYHEFPYAMELDYQRKFKYV